MARRAESSWLEPGVLVGGHEIVRQLSNAGPELRYLARSPGGTPATVITTRQVFADRRERSRFRRVAAGRAALDHPAAIRIRAVTEYAHQPVVIADPYPECTLADLLEHDAPLPPERVVALLAPVAEALDRAHAMGVVHRTLSAGSLLLADRERLSLDAFGLLVPEGDGELIVLGTRDVRTISPEQVRGLPTLPSSNVYSLTALAVHALTGEPPFTGQEGATMYAHLINEPAMVSERRPELGQEIDAVVRAGMAKQPENRPSSAMELLRMTAAALRVPCPDAEAPLSKRPRLRLVAENPAPAAPPRGRPRVSALLAVVLIAASVAVGALAALALAPFGDHGSRAAARPVTASAWRQLAEERAELRGRLSAAKTPQAQAEAASALGSLYGTASETGQPRALARAAGDAGLGYNQLAAAAGKNDEAGYAQAARAVEQAEARLSVAASRP